MRLCRRFLEILNDLRLSKIFKTKPGEISEKSCWVCIHRHKYEGKLEPKGFMYISDTFLGLLKEMAMGWEDDRNLAG